MKRYITLILSITFSAILFSSCSVYEEVTFHKDGRMSYNMKFDAAELMKMFPEKKSPVSKTSDSIIYVGQMLKDEKMDIINKYPELSEDIENISPIFIRTVENEATGEFYVAMCGEFKDAREFNKAFGSMARIASASKDMDIDVEGMPASGKNKNMVDWIGHLSDYEWDGKKMKRKMDISKLSLADEDENEEPSSKDPFSDWRSFFGGGKMAVKYHFPKKVKSVSNTEALLSQDGKTVIIEYPASVFTTSPQEADIEIRLE